MKALLVPALILVLHLPAQAVTRYVNIAGASPLAPYTNLLHAATNIQDAVDASAAGDVIEVSPGTYSLPLWSVEDVNIVALLDVEVTLRGTGGANNTIIDGAPWTARGVLINNVNATVDGFTIRNGYGDATYGGGGALCYYGGRVVNCVIENCWSDGWGGGWYGYHGGLISNSMVRGNGAAWNGGGIGLVGHDAVVDSCMVSNNVAHEYGGGIHFDGGGQARRTSVLNNRSFMGGGLAFFWNGTATACRIEGNAATNGDGGGVYFYQGGAVLHSTNNHNSAADQGGGAFLDAGGRLGATLVASNNAYVGGGVFISTNGLVENGCVIRHNVATHGGGGVVMDQGGRVESCAMQYNTATAFGGGAVLNEGGTLIQSDVIGNKALAAEGLGGGVYVQTAGLVSGCYIVSNQVPHGGGGVMLRQGGELKDSDVYWNLQTTAGYGNGGGGILCYEGGTASNCFIYQNDSAEAGGGVFCSLTGVVVDCYIINNNADSLGGGMAGDFGGLLDRCTVSWNQCGGLGGGVFYDDRGGIVQNCMITHNLAVTNGGGLFFDEELGSLINCTVVANLAGTAGAGLYGKTNLMVKNSIVYYNTNFANQAWKNYYIEPGATGAVFESVCTDPVPVLNAASSNCFSADPLLVRTGDFDYRLQPTSPCLEAGAPLGVPSHDRFGTPRPLDGNHDGTAAMDVGAHEYMHPLADSDHDGLLDTNELALGTSPIRSDSDDDGSGDGDEMFAGTDPLNPASVFELVSSTRPSGQVNLIRWASVAGKQYTLSVSSNLMLGFTQEAVHVPATPPENVYTDSVSAARSRYYRIEVE